MSKPIQKLPKKKKIHKNQTKKLSFSQIYFVGYFRINLARNWTLPQRQSGILLRHVF